MNISETNDLKARIHALEARVESLEKSLLGQKSANIPARDFSSVQNATLHLKKA